MIPPIVIRIVGKDAFATKLNTVGKEIGQFGKQMQSVGRNMSMYLSAPMAVFGAHTLKTAGDFQYGMNRVKAITGATGDDFALLKNKAMELGESTIFTANQVTEGMQLMAQAGMGVENTYKGVGTVLNNASANMIEMGESAGITAGLMRAYKKPVEELVDVTDIMTKTSISSLSNFTELADAFLYAGPTAAAMGKTLEETAGVLGVLANGMLKGSMAGTAMRGMMAKLTAPSAQAVEIMQSLGISYDDILDKKGNLRSFVDVVKAFENTSITAGEVLQIFGLRAGPGFQVMLNTGSKGVQDMMDTVKDFGGTTDRIAKIQLEGFKGQMWKLKSAFEGFELAIAESGLLVWATNLTEKFTEFFRKLSRANPTFLKFATILGTIAVVSGPILFFFGTMLAMLPFMIAGWTTLAIVVNLALWPIVLIIAYLAFWATALYLVWKNWAKIKLYITESWKAFTSGFVEIKNDILWLVRWLSRVGDLINNLKFGQAWKLFREGMGTIFQRGGPGPAPSTEKPADFMQQYMYSKTRSVIDVNIKSDKMAEVYAGAGEGVDELNVNQGRTFGEEW